MKPLALVGVGGVWALYLGGALVVAALLVPEPPPAAVTVPVPIATPHVVELACEDPDVVDAPAVPPFDPSAEAAAGAPDEIQAAVDALSYGAAPEDLVPIAARAVRAAPGSPKARYVLACALSLGGDPDAAYAQLEPLRAGCDGCQDALANLATDLTCQWRDDAREIAAPPSRIRHAALTIQTAAEAGDLTIAEPYLGRRFELVTACSVCDEGHPDDRRRVAPSALLDTDDTFVHFPQRLWCEGSCCHGDIGYLSHSADFVVDLCFDHATRLASVYQISGG